MKAEVGTANSVAGSGAYGDALGCRDKMVVHCTNCYAYEIREEAASRSVVAVAAFKQRASG